MLKAGTSSLPAVRESFNRTPQSARSCKILNGQQKSNSIQAVENALMVLETICESDGVIRVSTLSESLGMNKSSLWRLLATFTQRGYLEREERSGRYSLGLSAYAMGIKFRLRSELLSKAKPVMNHLARDCNEAIYLAVPSGKSFILLDMVDTVHAVRTMPLIGNVYSLNDTAVGKVIRACDTTLGANADDYDELESIRKQGAGVDYGGFGESTACVAFPLFNAHRKICGILCTIGPEFRFPPERIEGEFFPLLKEASRVISSRLGYI